MSRIPVWTAALAVVLAATLAGCTPEDRDPVSASGPDVLATGSCLPGSTSSGTPASGSSGTPAGPGSSPGAGQQLPDVALPCLDGSGTVALRRLAGPAVINLWASWCPPCREELPAFQRYAERAGGRVAVIGVDTADRREAANSIVEDLGLTFPNLYDPRSQLRNAMGGRPLPVTLFVAADGAVAYVYNDRPLDDADLDRLVREHLGVVVTG